MHTQKLLKAAPLTSFRSLRAPLMFGQFLSDVKQIERSIEQYGLMMPIIVSKANNQLVVVDGKKRLAAIKRMSFAGTLPRSLVKIPYVFVDDIEQAELHAANIISAYDVYKFVMTLKSQGLGINAIAETLYLCRKTVTDFISLSHLATPIRKAFFKATLSFDQAKAYATLPREEEQIRLLTLVGPFAEANEILDSIKSKDFKTHNASFELYADNVVTLPKVTQNYVWQERDEKRAA